jgi:hypothetical protein
MRAAARAAAQVTSLMTGGGDAGGH